MSDDAPKVVSLRGDPIVQPGEPVEAVITEIEELLEMARSGEIKGFAAAVLFTDDAVTMRRPGVLSRSIIGTLEIMKLDICEALR